MPKKTSYHSNHSKVSLMPKKFPTCSMIAQSPPLQSRDDKVYNTPQQPGVSSFNFNIAKSYMRNYSQVQMHEHESYHDEDS